MTRSQRQRLVGDRYVLGPTIGVGGMAEVFLGTDTRLGRPVAVKVLRADLARDPTFQHRFRREAQSAASLNASSIVSVFDTGEDEPGGSPWIVMEHVDGRTLREVLTGEHRLLPRRALEVVADVCGALQVAHASHIVHRDIKPGNVMLTPSGEVKVMDFGIARAAAGTAQTMTQTAAVLGTAAYLSPEQARGEQVDARSDIYSTGCLLYELVTGRPPFSGDSPIAVAYQHVREDPAPPSQHDPSLSPQLDAVVLKALAKNPANRYQTAEQMRQDLLRAAAGQRVEAPLVMSTVPGPTASGSRRVGLPRRARRGLLAALVGLLLVAALGGLAVGAQQLLSRPATVSTPDLLGRTQDQAQAALADAGLRLGPVTRRTGSRPDGAVLAQQPAAGAPLEGGGSVALVISSGPQQVRLPDVLGLPREQARAALQAARLTLAEITEADAPQAPGVVLAMSPSADSLVPGGAQVRLVVSTGRVPVPQVVGTGRGAAMQALEQAGFVARVQRRTSAGPAGVVLSQDPRGTAERGSTVQIVVSRPAGPSPMPTPIPTPTPTPTLVLPTLPPPAVPTAPPSSPPPLPTGTPGSTPPAPADRA